MLNDIFNNIKIKMNDSINYYKKCLNKLTIGQNQVLILGKIKVNIYENTTLLNKISTIQVINANKLIIHPWNKSSIKIIVKSIFEANLGLLPIVDKEVINIFIPNITKDKRKQHVKQAKKYCEETKIIIRNIRREANNIIKKYTKESKLSVNDKILGIKTIQNITNQQIMLINNLLITKNKTIMTI